MVLNVVLLDNHENFIRFLNPELISLEETCEQGHVKSLNVTYWVEDFENAKNDFKVGNKLWVSGDKNLTDCLYVIDTTIERDYFKENNIVFEVEEVLVELNYAPPFCQIDLNDDNGFTVTDTGVVTVDRNALAYWFGDYFNIGIVQEVLHNNFNKILPKGTMNLMDLLRFIEEETSNVFLTRYIKDPKNNIIHRYLDFLNPNNSDKSWDLIIDYDYPTPEELPTVVSLTDEEIQTEEIIDEEDIVTFPDEKRPEVTPAENLKLRLVKNNNPLLYKLDDEYLPLDFNASEIGVTGNDEEYEITLKSYTNTVNDEIKHYLTITVVAESYNANEDDMNSTEIVNGPFEVDLPNGIEVQLYDDSQKILFNYPINTLLGKIQEDRLDLGHNTENIKYEIEETDTFNAIAPILNNDDLTKRQLDTLINNWINLNVTKGTLIPMIVQRVNDSASSKSYNNPENYWSKPIKANDDKTNNSYEYWRGTAYWRAPFNKLSGESYVADSEDTGIEYNEIFRRKDVEFDSDMESSTPKIGNVETSDEDPYAIFNDVCMTLKNKRYHEINIEVDVANYFNGKSNNYDLYDKVYVKIPTIEGLVVATVSKTIKNAHDIGTNKIELSNYSINTKKEQLETELTPLHENNDFKYPNRKDFIVTLTDSDETPLPNQYISIALLKVENESASSTGTVYSLLTNDKGQVKITMKYDPGDYQFDINYGGDTGYESSTATVNFRVTGTKEVPLEIIRLQAKSNQKVKTKKVCWNKYGESPKAEHIYNKSTVELLKGQTSKGNLILAIGKAVTKADKKIWGTHLIRTIFEKKCARCGSTKLYWGYKWNGKKDKGTFKPTKTVEPGALTGRVICAKCGTSYDVTGKAGNKRLKITQATTTKPISSKSTLSTELKKLQKGTLTFGTMEYIVSTKKAPKNQGTVMSRSNNPGTGVSGPVKSSVKKAAKNIVDTKKGVSAAKAIAKWISKNIKNEDREGFYQSPAKTLSRKKGNSYCKTDLFLQMCDAVGVVNTGISCYYVYTQKKKTKSKKKTKTKKKTKKKITKHVLARVNGKWVDVTMKNPWGHHRTGFGALKNATIVRYPNLPLSRKY